MPAWFTRQLLRWHDENPRPLPWTGGPRDAYHIWISEIIMQQTRIEQGAPYYLRFISRFPSVFALATAPVDDVLLQWQGLGYYSRARNIHKAARTIVSDLKGVFPTTHSELLQLPGIGPYSAAAIASFAFGLSFPVVDGNVKRLLARFIGIDTPIDLSSTQEFIRSKAGELMNGADPGEFNQAIMNFGSLICKPKNPLCIDCPLSAKCFAFQHDQVSRLPITGKRKPLKQRHLHFIVLHHGGNWLAQKRLAKDIWQGLYTPLLVETGSERKPSSNKIFQAIQSAVGHVELKKSYVSSPVKQLLSHQSLWGKFYHYQLLEKPKVKLANSVWLSKKKTTSVGKPKMIAEYFLKNEF